MQERLESAPSGRILISVVLVCTILGIVAWALPESRLQQVTARLAEPYVYATGLDEHWGVFAPNPRREVIGFSARLTFADGTSSTWRPPEGDRFVGPYANYRWRKWVEYVIANSRRDLWDSTAAWIAREQGDDRNPVRQVTLTRRWRPIPPPSQDNQPTWQESDYYTWIATGSTAQ